MQPLGRCSREYPNLQRPNSQMASTYAKRSSQIWNLIATVIKISFPRAPGQWTQPPIIQGSTTMNARRPGAGSFTVGQLKTLSNLPDRAGTKFQVLYWHLTLVPNWATRYRNFEPFLIYLQENSIIKPYQRDLIHQNSWLIKLKHFWGYFQQERSYRRRVPPFWYANKGTSLQTTTEKQIKSSSCLPWSSATIRCWFFQML